jgi:predicted RNA-binding Zn-ribbon protein involved in translation (DUF1610 family)
MNTDTEPKKTGPWQCAKCGHALAIKSVNVSYLGAGYPVELLSCPQCGKVLVPEDLALGKMAEVEQILEDK